MNKQELDEWFKEVDKINKRLEENYWNYGKEKRDKETSIKGDERCGDL